MHLASLMTQSSIQTQDSRLHVFDDFAQSVADLAFSVPHTLTIPLAKASSLVFSNKISRMY